MNVEEALEIVESVLEQGRLNKVQETVFRQSWEGASYGEIARISGYDTGYIKDTGYHLWQSLSKAFGYKVTKNNFETVLKRRSFVSVPSLMQSISNGNGASGKSVGTELQQIQLITRSPATVGIKLIKVEHPAPGASVKPLQPTPVVGRSSSSAMRCWSTTRHPWSS